ncbi:MAG TPA: phage major capsid protein [Opitutus sp.]|nr:phage major capsid protein [Opitutus sp.]
MTTQTRADQARERLVEATAVLIEELAKYENTPPTPEQLEHLNELKASKDKAKADFDEVGKFEALRVDAATMQDFLKQPANRPPHADSGEPMRERRGRISPKSLGQKFAADENYQAWLKSIAPNGKIPDSARIPSSPAFAFGGLNDLQPMAALLTGASSTSGGAMIYDDNYPGLIGLGRRELTIRDLVTPGQTDSDTVTYVRVTSETNNAAPVAEATATGDGSGVKPESAMAFERVSTTVKTIAHWIPATKAALADAGQLRTLIDAFLRDGLEEELEDQMLTGDGSGENFTGIFNTTGTQTQAWDTDIFATTRKAITKMRTVARRRPTAWAMLPATLEFLDLQKDGEERYYNGGPFGPAGRTLWGYPIVETEGLPTGFALLGDFKRAVLWDREQASIQVSDSHSDFFIRNLVAILAEMRAAFGVLQPNAFVEVDVVA